MQYKLLIVDVDGTLVGRDGKISTEDKTAMAEARRAGVAVSLSTGRVAKACLHILNELALDGYHIFFDGAYAGTADGKEIYARPLQKEMVKQIIEFARWNHTYLELYSIAKYFIEQETWGTQVHQYYFNIEPTRVDFTTIWDKERIIKGELFVSSPAEEAQAKAFEAKFAGTIRFSWASTPACLGVHFVNIVDPGVSKGVALEALAKYLGISPAEVMAVGDGVNDISLLASAGLAVAMGNAPEEVKSIADFVTLDIEHNGLAAAIRKHLPPG